LGQAEGRKDRVDIVDDARDRGDGHHLPGFHGLKAEPLASRGEKTVVC